MKLCFATHNPGKLRELQALLTAAGLGLEVVTLAELGVADDVVEDGKTFADNARIKAVAAQKRTGLWSLSDDSGLEVDALGGAPGVYSARYGGEPKSDERNRQALLAALSGVPAQRRSARFRCVLCLRGPDGTEALREGLLEGALLDGPRGSGGFGYDPLFVPDQAPAQFVGRTLAQMPPEVKNLLSHRARAMAAMRPVLARLFAQGA